MTDDLDDLDYDEFFIDSMLFGTKVCVRCRAEKPLSIEHWHHDRREDSGFSRWCKECRDAGYRKAYEADDYREKRSRSNAAWRASKRAAP